MGKPAGRRKFGRTRPSWEDIIKMDFTEVERAAWSASIRLRIGNAVMNVLVP